MRQADAKWVRLPLESTHNVRDLGGIPTACGSQTAWGQFLRAGDISALTERDTKFLLDYGVRTVIDLRSSMETGAKPGALGEQHGVTLHLCPFFEFDVSAGGMGAFLRDAGTMPDIYMGILREQSRVRAAMGIIAGAAEGCVLFHCTAGKDRTGVLSLLLLMLAGADRQDCVNNYTPSFTNLTRDWSFFERNSDKNNVQAHFMLSNAEYIEGAYDFVASHSGGVEGYLTGCGVSPTEIDIIKRRIICPLEQ